MYHYYTLSGVGATLPFGALASLTKLLPADLLRVLSSAGAPTGNYGIVKTIAGSQNGKPKMIYISQDGRVISDIRKK